MKGVVRVTSPYIIMLLRFGLSHLYVIYFIFLYLFEYNILNSRAQWFFLCLLVVVYNPGVFLGYPWGSYIVLMYYYVHYSPLTFVRINGLCLIIYSNRLIDFGLLSRESQFKALLRIKVDLSISILTKNDYRIVGCSESMSFFNRFFRFIFSRPPWVCVKFNSLTIPKPICLRNTRRRNLKST